MISVHENWKVKSNQGIRESYNSKISVIINLMEDEMLKT